MPSQIPTVPGSEQVNTPSQTVRMDPGIAGLAGRGMIALGGAVQDVGEVAQQFSDRMVHARNAKALLDADLTMSKTTADFRDSLKDMPDEAEWVPKYQEKVQEVQESIASQKLAPVVRRQLQMNLQTWAQHTTSEIKTAATTRYVSRIEQTGRAQVDQAIRDQDPERAYAGIGLMKSVGAIHPKDAERLEASIPSKIDIERANSAILSDPVKAASMLKDGSGFPALSAKQREQLWREADRSKNRLQTDNLDGLYRQHQAGAVIDPEQIDSAVQAGTISGRGGLALQAMMDREQKAAIAKDKKEIADQNKSDAQTIWEDIQNYDASTDTTGQQHADIAARIMELPMAYATRLQSQLKGQVKKGNVDATDDGMKVIQQFYQEGVFGDTSNEDGKKVARVKSWDAQEALQKYRKEYPNASHKDEREFLQQITGPDVFNKVTAALRGTNTPAAAPFAKGARVREKSTGKLFDYDGTKLVPVD